MKDVVYDRNGNRVATIRDGDLFGPEGLRVGTVRRDNVYDRNGKFVFHLMPSGETESAGSMTVEAVGKLLHPK